MFNSLIKENNIKILVIRDKIGIKKIINNSFLKLVIMSWELLKLTMLQGTLFFRNKKI